jgi:hypothetical protein
MGASRFTYTLAYFKINQTAADRPNTSAVVGSST